MITGSLKIDIFCKKLFYHLNLVRLFDLYQKFFVLFFCKIYDILNDRLLRFLEFFVLNGIFWVKLKGWVKLDILLMEFIHSRRKCSGCDVAVGRLGPFGTIKNAFNTRRSFKIHVYNVTIIHFWSTDPVAQSGGVFV